MTISVLKVPSNYTPHWPGVLDSGYLNHVVKENMSMNVLPFLRRKGDVMKAEKADRNEEPKKASIILPQYLWDIVEKDAKRCRRSVTKQIEAILVRYYNVEANVDLDERAIAEAFHVVSQRRMKA